MFKANYKDTSSVFIVSFEHISHLALVFLSLNLNMLLPAGSGIRRKALALVKWHDETSLVNMDLSGPFLSRAIAFSRILGLNFSI